MKTSFLKPGSFYVEYIDGNPSYLLQFVTPLPKWYTNPMGHKVTYLFKLLACSFLDDYSSDALSPDYWLNDCHLKSLARVAKKDAMYYIKEWPISFGRYKNT